MYNISKLSPTKTVSNIRPHHRCSRSHVLSFGLYNSVFGLKPNEHQNILSYINLHVQIRMSISDSQSDNLLQCNSRINDTSGARSQSVVAS